VTESFPPTENVGTVRLVEIVYDFPDIICATQEPVFLCWWRRTPTALHAQGSFDLLQKVAKSTPGGVVFIVITSEGVSQPDRGTADFFARSTRSIEKHILAHAFILEGTGLRSAAVRTAVRAMQTMSRVIFPWTISATVDEGIMFLAKKTGFITEPEARKLIADIATLRSTHPAPPKP